MQFRNKHIVVVGDVMLDTFIFGKSTRRTPEADVPVLIAERSEYVAGGAANVAANIIGLGAKCTLISIAGQDEAGDKLRTVLNDQGCSAESIKTSTTRKTTQKTRFYHQNNMLLRLDSEDMHLINDEEQSWLWNSFEDVVNGQQVDGLIIQDYNKGICHPKTNKRIIDRCNLMGIPVFVDPKLAHYDSYMNANYVKPNIHELASVLNVTIDPNNEDSIKNAIYELKKYIYADNYLITMGSKGVYFSNSEQNGVISTIPIEQADVCGAGDTFISGFALAITSGVDLSQSLQIANTLSGYACKKRGVQPVLLKDLNKQHRSQLIWNV